MLGIVKKRATVKDGKLGAIDESRATVKSKLDASGCRPHEIHGVHHGVLADAAKRTSAKWRRWLVTSNTKCPLTGERAWFAADCFRPGGPNANSAQVLNPGSALSPTNTVYA